MKKIISPLLEIGLLIFVVSTIVEIFITPIPYWIAIPLLVVAIVLIIVGGIDLKNKSVLIRVFIYIAMTFIVIFLEPKINNVFLGVLCVVLYLTVVMLLISWRTFNCIWVCDECETKFEISLWESIKRFSVFSLKNKLYHRQLYCNKCKRKTWCRCIFK